MEEQFIPYDLALELKELGFDEECFGVYSKADKTFYLKNTQFDLVDEIHFIKAPLWQQAFDFLHNGLFSWIERNRFIGDKYSYSVNIQKEDGEIVSMRFKTSEEARLQCLKKLIEMVNKYYTLSGAKPND